LRLFFIAILIAAVVYLATAGHVLFLPLLLFLPLGFAGSRRRSRRRGGWL
jgi:hypothetical protein